MRGFVDGPTTILYGLAHACRETRLPEGESARGPRSTETPIVHTKNGSSSLPPQSKQYSHDREFFRKSTRSQRSSKEKNRRFLLVGRGPFYSFVPPPLFSAPLSSQKGRGKITK